MHRKFYPLKTQSQAASKHHTTSTKPIKLIRNNLKIHFFPITKFTLTQTKLGKLYTNIKSIYFFSFSMHISKLEILGCDTIPKLVFLSKYHFFVMTYFIIEYTLIIVYLFYNL